MITAVDTSILIDVFRDDPDSGQGSAEALRECLRTGSVVACDIVWSELAAVFPSSRAFEKVMETLSVEFQPVGKDTALLAGEMWRKYRQRGGNRSRVIPDFLIGAHAQRQCDRLLTRDRGFYRTYFSKLRVLDRSSRPYFPFDCHLTQ